jgi:hypothetical protein
MLSYQSTQAMPPAARGGSGGSIRNDEIHCLVRAAIAATPPGSMRMMSAGLMVELLLDHGLEEGQAKR